MFEDSLVESQGRIRTRSRGFAIISFVAQAALLLLLILLPLFHPEALPKQSLERLLVAPPPAASPAPVLTQRTTSAVRQPMQSLQALIAAPRVIPTNIHSGASEQAPPSIPLMGDGGLGNPGDGVLGGLPVGTPTLIVAAQPRPAPKGPVVVSSGVAAGQLIGAIRPTYPRIAIEARIQGTVVVEATISRTGTIEDLHVTEGPPMLRQAAIDAVSAAHYRPYLLNGEPVEVQTSVRVVFSLGQ